MADRIVRLVIGVSLVLFAAAGLFPGVWAVVVPAVGLIPLVTAAFGYCPVYRLLGLDGSRSALASRGAPPHGDSAPHNHGRAGR